VKPTSGSAPKSVSKHSRQHDVAKAFPFIQRAKQALSSPQPPLTIQEQERISHVSWTGTWKRHSNPLLR